MKMRICHRSPDIYPLKRRGVTGKLKKQSLQTKVQTLNIIYHEKVTPFVLAFHRKWYPDR